MDPRLTDEERKSVIVLVARGFEVWQEGDVWALRSPADGFLDADLDLKRLLRPKKSPYWNLIKSVLLA
jgi:hypothetical protein